MTQILRDYPQDDTWACRELHTTSMPTSDLTFLYGESVPKCTHVIDKHFVGYQTLQYMTAGGVELSVGEERHAVGCVSERSADAQTNVRKIRPGGELWARTLDNIRMWLVRA